MYSLNCKGRLFSWHEPIVMGILNLTPDSFYAGSRIRSEEMLLRQAEKMVSEGAAILDFGGLSSRPGALEISRGCRNRPCCSGHSSGCITFPDLPYFG